MACRNKWIVLDKSASAAVCRFSCYKCQFHFSNLLKGTNPERLIYADAYNSLQFDHVVIICQASCLRHMYTKSSERLWSFLLNGFLSAYLLDSVALHKINFEVISFCFRSAARSLDVNNSAKRANLGTSSGSSVYGNFSSPQPQLYHQV